MAAEPSGGCCPGESFGSRLAAATAAVTELAAAADLLGDVPDDDVTRVMGQLTTLVAQLNGLRVAVTGLVRQRGLYRLRGASNVAGWLRADARTADEAWQLSRLAALTPQLPRISGLLAEGSVSLSQAGTACWQISQLPSVVTRPDETDAEAGTDGNANSDPDGAADADPDPDASNAADAPPSDPPDSPDDRWAGLWRSGDVHAAADELFARFLPGMDGEQLRVLGAHLREAADVQEHAGEDYSEYAHRSLRVSRTLGGIAHLTGRLHPEAAEQVIAAFEELGAKAGPDDQRTRAQRWADALAYLTGLICPSPAPGPGSPGTGAAARESAAGVEPDAGCDGSGESALGDPATEADDDDPSPDGGHGHHDPAGPGALRPAGPRELRPAGPRELRPAGPGGIIPAGARRPRVIVTVPLPTLLGEPLAPGAVVGAGVPVTAEAARRLSCDAEIIRLITGQPPPGLTGPSGLAGPPGAPGNDPGTALDATAQLTALLADAIAGLPRPLGAPSAALDIGRKSQSWTPRQRDALYAQYGGRCCRPGCTRSIDVIHHIVHWLFGGKTQIVNGAPVCLYDHWLVHEGGWRVTRQHDGALTFIPPPPGWRPGTIYRRGKPLAENGPHGHAA